MDDLEQPIRVVLVDDDALVRAGLKMILGGAPDIEIVGEADDGRAGLILVENQHPDVALMDIRMPVLDGIDATRRAAALPHAPRVLVLTTFDADDLVVQALRAGAAGFLLKDTRPEQLVGAVRAVAHGDPVLSPSVTRQIVARITRGDDSERSEARARLERLTAREREVADLVAGGLPNAHIAEQLVMSVPTVKAHVSNVLAKLDADNRVQVALTVRDARARY